MEYIPFGSEDKIRLTIEIVRSTIAIPTKSGKLPQDRDIVKFMMMCQAQRLNPYAGDAYLTGYDTQDGPKFSLITAHQALLKRAEVSDHFKGMLSGVIIQTDDGITEVEGDFYLPDQVVIGGWAKVFHAKREFPFYRRIRMERFNTGYAQWKVDAAGMICKTAEADALRSAFPTMLGGLYISEEQNLPADIVSSAGNIGAVPGRGVKVIEAAGTGDDHPPGLEPKSAEKATAKNGNPPPAGAPGARSPQDELGTRICEAGFTFDEFRKTASEIGVLEKADTIDSFEQVPAKDATRLLRAITGLLGKLAAAKEGVQEQ